jgi:hypothetical protein
MPGELVIDECQLTTMGTSEGERHGRGNPKAEARNPKEEE